MIFVFDSYELDAEREELWRGRKQVRIDSMIVRLLIVLVKNAGRLVTKEELISEVWEGRAVADNVLTVSMARLRKTLQTKRGQGEFVATVYGRGYRFLCQVIARDAVRATTPAPVGASPTLAPFFGRARLLSGLTDALAAAAAGRGRMCLVMGEAGIGKTRLAEELESGWHGTPITVAWAYCREIADPPPLSPFRQILREILPAPDFASEGPERGDLLLMEDDPGQRRSFERVLQVLTTCARQKPLLLIFDDLQRADAASIELLSVLVGQIARFKILVVATLRSGSAGTPMRPETQLPYLLGHRNCQRMTLEHLTERDVRAYVAAQLDDGDGRFGKVVFEKSRGNPFFMVELSRQLQTSEAPDPNALTLKGAALDLVRENVAKLDADARGLLSVAAVVGGSFELALLAALTGRPASSLVGSLDDAIAANVIVPAPQSRTAFAFRHELLGTVLYDALALAERRKLHQRVASALESRASSGERAPASVLAYHFHAALPESDLRKTVQYCTEAAYEAAAVFASADVVRFMRHALEALELIEKPSVKIRMRLSYFMTLYARGHDGAQYQRSVNELVRLSREHGDGDMLARAAALLNWHPGLKPLPGASVALHQALTLLPRDKDGVRGVALCALACGAPECFDRSKSERLLAEGVPLVRSSGSCAARYAGLLAQLYVMGGPDRERQPLVNGLLEELEKLAHESPKRLPVLPLDLCLYRAVSSLTRGDQAGMRGAIQRMLAHALDVHHVEFFWHGRRLLALADINGAAREAGIAALRALHAQAVRESLFNTLPFCAFDRAVVFADVHPGAPLERELLQALAFDGSEPPAIWSMNVHTLCGAGLFDQARAMLHTVATSDLAALPCDAHYLGTLGHLTRAALSLGELDYLRALTPLLARYPQHFAGHTSFLCLGPMPHLLALALSAQGQQERARVELERGLALSEAAGFPWLVGEARAVQAGWQRAHAAARANPSQLLQMVTGGEDT